MLPIKLQKPIMKTKKSAIGIDGGCKMDKDNRTTIISNKNPF